MFLNDNLKIFSGSSNPELAVEVCKYLGLPIGGAKISTFPDGEKLIRIEDDVRGRECFVMQSTCRPQAEHLMELLIYLDCLRRASAKRITAVVPYFGYARQDRKDEGRVPITAKLVANLITTAGADRVLAIDLHAHQLQGFFDIPVDHLTGELVLSRSSAGGANTPWVTPTRTLLAPRCMTRSAAVQIVPAVAIMSSHIRTLQPSTEPISSLAWTSEPLIRFLWTIARSPPKWPA